MAQTLSPYFPEEIKLVNNQVRYLKKDGIVFYFIGMMLLFQHPEKDLNAFRLIISQLVINGNAKQVEITEAFGISGTSVKRWVKRFKEEGAKGFIQ